MSTARPTVENARSVMVGICLSLTMTPVQTATLTGHHGAPVHVYPPLSRAATAPVVMMLHGMCMDAEHTCKAFDGPAREGSWLLCPAGNSACGGASDWQGDGARKAAFLDGSLKALDDAHANLVTHGEGVLVGFSRGAFVARDVVYERSGEWTGAIFIGAAFIPDATRFRAAGLRRVVFASGDYDGARVTMQKAARTLSDNGLEARFVSLGPIAHQLPHDTGPFVRESLAWIRDAPGESTR